MNQKSLFYHLAEGYEHYRAERLLASSEKVEVRSGWLRRFAKVMMPNIGTIVIVLALLFAQSAGALPLARSQTAPAATSTGTIAYQGRLADAEGHPLTQTINMTFRLWDSASGGTELWFEDWTGSNGVRVSDGLFNVMLGSLKTLPQSVIAGRNQLFLGITVGTDDEMAPRVQLGSVPFAVQALTVPDGSINGSKLASTGFGAGDKPLLNFVPTSPRTEVLTLQSQSTTDWLTLDLSPWLPVNTEAVLLYMGAADINSASIPAEMRFDKPGVRQGVFVDTPGAPNNHWQLEQGIVPVNSARVIEYKITASGTGTFRATVLIVGYYERANRP